MKTTVHKLPDGYLLKIDAYQWKLLQVRMFSPIEVCGNEPLSIGRKIQIKDCPALVKHRIQAVRQAVEIIQRHKRRTA